MEKRSGKIYKSLLLCITTFFYSGLISKKMPGTMGSFAATLVALLLPHTPSTYLAMAILTFVIGTIASQKYVIRFEEANPDPGYIVIDEACGIFVGCHMCLALPGLSDFYSSSMAPNFNIAIVLNFILFRVFDIWKPALIRDVEDALSKNKKTLGFGIMIDDVMAAILASFAHFILIGLYFL